MHYVLANDQGGHPRWWLDGNNREKAAHSGESFAATSSAQQAGEYFEANAPLWDYDVYPDAAKSSILVPGTCIATETQGGGRDE